MARKKDLRKLDSDTQAYWDEILKREELSMEAGRSRNLSYGYDFDDTSTLTKVGDHFYQTVGCGGGRRKMPKSGS